MMNVEREQIREIVAKLFDAEPFLDEMVGYLEQGAPALMHFICRKASGVLQPGRAVYDDFLRSMPEPVFDYLLERALDFFRRPPIREARLEDAEFRALAIFLWHDEHEVENFPLTDAQQYELMARLAGLAVIEEQTRAGAGVWLAHHLMLLRDGAVGPLRFPILEWITPD